MANAVQIDSNVTGLSYAKEESLRTLPVTPKWYPLEPNSYTDFGADIKTVARDPINQNRQRKKGTTTDLDATAGFISDLTQTNLQEALQGLFFANFRRKAEYGYGESTSDFTGIATSDDSYNASAGLDVFKANDLLMAAGFSDPANNGLRLVNTAVAAKVTVTGSNLVDETPGADVGSLVQVGHQFASGTVDITTASTYPRITRASGSKSMLDFGLIPGEIVFIGGDGAGEKFATAANNGYARVRAVAATYIEFDKTYATMVAETGTGLTIRIFFGRVIKNELGTNIVRSTYQIERTLGAYDLAEPTEHQSEYIVGAVFNTAKITVPTADKVTIDIGYMGIDSETRDSDTGPKSGDRIPLIETDCFNTSSDVQKVKLAVITPGNANPNPLFSYIENLDLNVNNNMTPSKAVGVEGAFDLATGTFQVGAEMKAYFADIAAITSVRNNADVTFDAHFAKANAGFSIDIPLVSVGGARPDIAKNVAVKLPLTLEAATGAKVNANMDHTLLMVFFDYLPSLAMA